MSELLQSGHHPDADQLCAFVEHALSAHEREQTLAHLAVCPHCRSIVALSLPSATEMLKPSPEPVWSRWLPGWKPVWPAAAVLAAAIIAAVVVTHFHRAAVSDTAAAPPQMAALDNSTEEKTQPSMAPPEKLAFAPFVQSAQRARRPGGNPSAPPRAVPETDNAESTAKEFSRFPVNGRNVGSLLKLAPGAVPTQGAPSMQSSASGNSNLARSPDDTSVPRPAAAASEVSLEGTAPMVARGTATTVNVTSVDRNLETERPELKQLIEPDQARLLLSKHPLPSGLPAISTAANAREVLAIDSWNNLFLTRDSGKHWKTISTPWRGRAIKLDLVSSLQMATTSNAGDAVAPSASVAFIPEQGAIAGSAPAPAGIVASGLAGVVQDQSGAVIAGASVTVSDASTGVLRTVKTDSNGRYFLYNLVPASYSLKVEAPGFRSERLQAIKLPPAQMVPVDVTLAVGSVTEAVEVRAESSPGDLGRRQVKNKADPSRPPLTPFSRFEITTDAGEHWTSIDGRTWRREAR